MAVFLRVPDLAGQQADSLAEEALALLFTDAPVTESPLSPGNTRGHWQWRARPTVQGSRLWINFGAPLTDSALTLIESRAETALAELITRKLATSVAVVATQLTHTSISLVVTIGRQRDRDLTFGVSLGQAV
jgi:phage gp46-like protein